MTTILAFFAVIAIVSVFIRALGTYGKSQKNQIGSIYKKQLQLNKQEVRLLNKLNPEEKAKISFNFFTNELIKLFISVFRELIPQQQSDFELNQNLMNYCKCIIRNTYLYNVPSFEEMELLRKSLPLDIIDLVEEKAKSEVRKILTDEEEEILFRWDKKRAKRIYENIANNFDKSNPNDFYNKICQLVSLAKARDTTARDIYYRSYNFMALHHKKLSLKFYLHYLNVESTSPDFIHKEIGVRNAKRLFTDDNQKKEFDVICKKCKKWKNSNIDKAFELLDEMLIPKRKKITLNVESILREKEKHSKVTQLLGEYLDEEEVIEIIPEKVEITESNNQKELFELFISNSFRLNQQEINIFAQSKNLFKDQFIESINDAYYEEFDDLLIEEEGEEYILNKEYYEQIMQ